MKATPRFTAQGDTALGGRIKRRTNRAEWPRLRAVMAAGVAALLLAATAAIAYAFPPPGTVTAWGYNGSGQLGNGTTASSSTPITVLLPSGVIASAIAAGSFHNLAITNDGLYTWGGGATLPVKVTFPKEVMMVTAVAAGGGHSLAITNDGLYAWGANSSGQLGDGTTIDRATPVKVNFPPTVTAVTAVAAGSYHSLAITNDGLYAWGSNGGAQLGDGTRFNRSLPVQVISPSLTTVRAIAGGGYHSLAVTDDGLFTWGNNTFGQLGDGSTRDSTTPELINIPSPVTTVTSVAAGFWHSLVITNDGVYAFGYNGNGELGNGTWSDSHVPVKSSFPSKVTTALAIAAGSDFSLAITDDGLYAWGNNALGQLGITGKPKNAPNKVKAENNVVAIGAGYYHSLALH